MLGILWRLYWVNYLAHVVLYKFFYNMLAYLWACNYYFLYYYSVFVACVANVYVQVNCLLMLNGKNFKIRKELFSVVWIWHWERNDPTSTSERPLTRQKLRDGTVQIGCALWSWSALFQKCFGTLFLRVKMKRNK